MHMLATHLPDTDWPCLSFFEADQLLFGQDNDKPKCKHNYNTPLDDADEIPASGKSRGPIIK